MPMYEIHPSHQIPTEYNSCTYFLRLIKQIKEQHLVITKQFFSPNNRPALQVVLSHSKQTGKKAHPEQLLIRWAPFCLHSKWGKCHVEKNTVYGHVIRHGNTGIYKRGGKTSTNYSCTGNLFLGVYNFWCSWTLALQFLLTRLFSS